MVLNRDINLYLSDLDTITRMLTKAGDDDWVLLNDLSQLYEITVAVARYPA